MINDRYGHIVAGCCLTFTPTAVLSIILRSRLAAFVRPSSERKPPILPGSRLYRKVSMTEPLVCLGNSSVSQSHAIRVSGE